MSRNNVRGPTSALTEFLRASGITPTTVAARRAAAEQEQQQPVAGPSGARGGEDDDVEMADGEVDAEEETATPRRRTRGGGRASAATGATYDSDDLDDAAEAVEKAATKKRKLSKAAEAKLKAKEKAKAKKKKKDEDGDYDDDDDDAEDDPYRALSTMWGGKGGASPAKPPVGSFEPCAKCGNQFTVTRYTMAAVPGPGFLCHKCAKATGNDPFKKPAAVKRKKVPVDRRTVVNFEERRFPTLASICIQLITKHIDDVESLGDIGALNVDAISKALSKNRALTPQNAQLFYSVTNTSLTFYDATNLTSPALETLIHLNPHLTSLRLDFCGHLNDTAMHTLSASLPALAHLELLGPFLVRPPAWLALFQSHPALATFRITQSPRFDRACVAALVGSAKGTLRRLRLREVGQMDDGFLRELARLERVEELDLGAPGNAEACSAGALQRLLEAVSGTLRVLDLSRHVLLTDGALRDGLAAARAVEALTLREVPLLTDGGVAAFFGAWGNPPVRVVELGRNYALGGKALEAVMRHSGERLEVLGINGWGGEGMGEEALRTVGRLGRELRKLDVGWVREVDDFVVKGWMEGEGEDGDEDAEGKSKGRANGRTAGCPRLSEVKVWGCNKITARCPKKKGVSIYGVESHTAI
ncbi:putative RNI-like protein [Lyophyllum shimeji]|uniref:RNI-like protein n=1 Tax=Lyophyllum shimeji TaxID=47721 RepID=A0A9P3ULR8_LYOSH|nr:putative RNI-like protein [Lyophyllum shimeji]